MEPMNERLWYEEVSVQVTLLFFNDTALTITEQKGEGVLNTNESQFNL